MQEPVMPASHKYKPEQIQKILDNLPGLYLEGYKHEKMKCSDFLKNFFKNFNKKYSTYDASTKDLQCVPGKRRSLTDVYRLLKFYYPRTADIALISKLMKKIVEEGSARGNICSQVHRRVYMYDPKKESVNTEQADEFGLTWDEFIDIGENYKPTDLKNTKKVLKEPDEIKKTPQRRRKSTIED